MIQQAVAVVLGGLLVAGAVAKLAAPRRTMDALATHGLSGRRGRAVAWGIGVASEVGLGVAVAVGSEPAALVAAGLVVALAGVLVVAILRGRTGAPCGCLGARSRVGRAAVARNLALAGALAVVPWLDRVSVGRDDAVVAVAAAALVGVLVLAVLLLGLAREVATLRLRLGPQMALELEGEGPDLGAYTPWLDHGEGVAAGALALAIFTSAGCPMCRALQPAVAELRRDDRLRVTEHDEHDDPDAWADLAIPGSPYAVVASADGRVIAKGTFNSLGQLDALLHSARERRETHVSA